MNSRLLLAGCVCSVIACRSLFALENPLLSIASVTNLAGRFEISWPVSASNWVLESSLQLPPSAPWNCMAPETYESRGQTARVVQVTAGIGNRFYRLRRLTPRVPAQSVLWRLDEGTGQTGGDGSGSGASLSLSAVSWGAGRFGPGSLRFNGGAAGAGGSRAWVSNQNFNVLPAAGKPFSVSLWLNPDSVPVGSSGLMGNNTTGTNGWGVALQTTGPGTNLLVFSGAGGSMSVTGRTLLLPGQWHQLTVTHDGVEGRVYADSELLAVGAGAIATHAGPIYFGGGVGGYDSFLGRMDDIRAYTNCLAAEEISLTGRWQFDEGCDDFAADSSVQGHHASVTDSSAWVPGHAGTGIDLNIGSVIISNADYAVLPRSGAPFSISFRVRPASLPAGRSGLMNCGTVDLGGWQLALQRDGANSRLHFTSTNFGGTLDLSAPVELAAGSWSKVDVTFNGGMATLYANGRKLGAGSGAIRGSQAALTIGTAPGATNFNGAIDDLKIYSRERGESEVMPVAPAIWETVFANTTTNLVLPGAGPSGRPLIYSIVPDRMPTNGTVSMAGSAGIVAYAAGARKGPDAFTYTVSDGEFTSPPGVAMVSVVSPHWLSPAGGGAPPLDGSSPAKAWAVGSTAVLDAIWNTNNFYDCFLYAPGVYQTRGWSYTDRSTANPGCKHIGSGSSGAGSTTLRLVDIVDAFAEEMIFSPKPGERSDGFEVQHLILDCNAENVPKYALGEPIWIRVPLQNSGLVSNVTFRWAFKSLPGSPLVLGRAAQFSVCAIQSGTNTFLTNCTSVLGTGQVSVVSLGSMADELRIQVDRRAAGVDFYGLSELEISGATTCVPVATVPEGGESRLNAEHSIIKAVDPFPSTAWASGPESRAQLEFPLPNGTSMSQVNLRWNCKTILGTGRLGPAAGYLIRAWDDADGQFHDVPFVSHGRLESGLETVSFGTTQVTNSLITSRLMLLLTNREPGVDYYSLRDVTFQDGDRAVPLPMPTAMNSCPYGDFTILRAFDRDAATEWASGTQGAVSAMALWGDNLKFLDLRIIGFGTKAGRECFPVFLIPSQMNPPGRVGNILMEDCILSDPATHNADGVTGIALIGHATVALTNAVVRRCSVLGLKPYFPYSQSVGAMLMESCVVSNCHRGVYLEPDPSVNIYAGGDDYGLITIRSNLFVDVDYGIYVATHPGTSLDSLSCIANEIVLAGANGWGFLICDTCAFGPVSTATNILVMDNIVRFPGWTLRPGNADSGLYYSDIHNAVFGNNVIALGTYAGIRVRGCPSGLIPFEMPVEDCEHPLVLPLPPPATPPCVDTLLPGYRRAWFGNRDISGGLVPVRFYSNFTEGLASQQQWPD